MAEQREPPIDIVYENALRDPSYCPYCLRCSGLKRMRKVGEMHWRCDCGAEHVIPHPRNDPRAIEIIANSKEGM